MRAKTAFGMALLTWALGLASAQAQNPPAPTREQTAPRAIVGGQPGEIVTEPGALSEWITYDSYGNSGMVGAGIPVLSELFLRSGLSVPTSAGSLGRVLDVGWDIEGGGKLLFFNPTVDRAWVVWAGITNISNYARDQRTTFDITDFFQTGINPFTNQPIIEKKDVKVTVNRLNRTYVDLALGREWYLWGSANTPENRWRVGIDSGGRWGSAKIDLNEIPHRTDVIGAWFTGFYGDLAIPVGACTVLGGVRGEIDYTWSDILQGSNDVMSINVLFSLGILF